MWKLTPYGQTRTGLPGVPWQDLTDEEFAAAEELHPGIRDRGYFERETPEGEPVEIPRRFAAPVPRPISDEATASIQEIIGGRPPRTRKGS